MQRVFVFPGQGSQSVGMLKELAAASPIIDATFAQASEVLGFDLWALAQDGPAEKLNETVNTQPAMLAAGVATWRYWCQHGGAAPAAVAGHSLGEFAALVAAGSIEFPTAVRLVRRRAELMQQAVPAGQGAIAAVLGMDDAAVVAACAESAQGEVVETVNFNSPGQVVIAGHSAAVQRALAACKAGGAKRAVVLPMSVPAHSSLMRPAAEQFAAELAATPIGVPTMAFWSPVDAQTHHSPQDIRHLMQRQLVSAVRWTDLVRALLAAGTALLVECGPGKVLTGLNRRVDKRPDLECLALQDPDSVQIALTRMT